MSIDFNVQVWVSGKFKVHLTSYNYNSNSTPYVTLVPFGGGSSFTMSTKDFKEQFVPEGTTKVCDECTKGEKTLIKYIKENRRLQIEIDSWKKDVLSPLSNENKALFEEKQQLCEKVNILRKRVSELWEALDECSNNMPCEAGPLCDLNRDSFEWCDSCRVREQALEIL